MDLRHKLMGNIPLTVFIPLQILLVGFGIIDAKSVYNIIMGCPLIHRLDVVLSAYHQVLGYHFTHDMLEIKGDQLQPHKCGATHKALGKVKQKVNQANDKEHASMQRSRGASQGIATNGSSEKDKDKWLAI